MKKYAKILAAVLVLILALSLGTLVFYYLDAIR